MAEKTRTVDRSVRHEYSWTRLQFTSSDTYVTNFGPYSNDEAKAMVGRKYTRTWNTYPGWKAFRAANGYIPTQNMTESQYSWSQPGPTIIFKYESGREERHLKGCYLAMPTQVDSYVGGLTSSERSALKLDAQYKCLEKARDMKVNLPVLFGEGRQTVRMIADTARTLGKAYRNFRRGRFRQAARDLGIDKPTGTSANHWLAYSYGWMPLLSDTKGLAELAAQQLELGGRPPRFSVADKALSIKRGKYLYAGLGPACLNDGDTTWTYETTHKSRAGLLCEVQFTEASLAAQTGFGLYDPLLTAWELTPFSFVFDWFISIGDWLASASALQGLTVKAGYVSVLSSSKGTSSFSRLWSGWSTEQPLPSVAFTVRDYERQNWMGTVSSIKTPLFDALNARRITTTAALWRQRTRGDRVPGKYRP